MLNYQKILNEIENTQNGELIIFAGAGISKNSGLPLANQLIAKVIEKLDEDENMSVDIQEKLQNLRMPFESFMEIILRDSRDYSLLNVYAKGKPNTNHKLIAHLAARGRVRIIVTTNFDCLIEEALESANVPYTLLSKNSDFNENSLNSHGVVIIKLHGTIQNLDSIKTTLSEVSNSQPKDGLKFILTNLLCNYRYGKKIIILGYSCSDDFDINPIVREVKQNKKAIYFIQHSNEFSGILDFSKSKTPFLQFPGYIIKSNTDVFVKDLWSKCIRYNNYPEFVRDDTGWLTEVQDWVERLPAGGNHFIIGKIYYGLSEYDKAYPYLIKAMNKFADNQYLFGLGGVCGAIASLCIAKDRYQEALECLEMAKQYREDDQNIGSEELAGIISDISLCYFKLNKFEQALKSLEEAEGLAQDNDSRLVTIYQNYGVLFKNNDIEKALKYFKRSLTIARKIGDQKTIGLYFYNIGDINVNRQEFKKATKSFRNALKIFKLIGYRKGICDTYNFLAKTYFARKCINICFGCYEKAIIWAYCDEVINLVYYNIGYTYYAIQNYSEALKYLCKAYLLCIQTSQDEIHEYSHKYICEIANKMTVHDFNSIANPHGIKI